MMFEELQKQWRWLLEFKRQLDRIEEKIDMTVTKPEFDAGLQQLEAEETTLTNDVAAEKSILAKVDAALTKFISDYQAKSGADLTSELAEVTALLNQSQANDAIVTGDTTDLSTDDSNIVAADV